MAFQHVFRTGDEEAPCQAEPGDVLARLDAHREDMFWRVACPRENYFRVDLDYEDYAPAYCVGYTGFVQYGGAYDDAQRCLWANWLRIKGDSRLAPHDATMAMRAAWSRMETIAVDGSPAGQTMQDTMMPARAPAESMTAALAREAA